MQSYSVLMTMYSKDKPEYAKMAIDSMLNQTVKTNDFVIICDGNLTSELYSLLEMYKNTYDVFNIIRLKQNVGLGEALRRGVEECKNNLIARMDDDDISRLDRCEMELLAFANDENLSICGSYMNEFDTDPSLITRVKRVPLTQDEIMKYSHRRNPFNHSTVMFRKDRILEVGNYSSMRTNQDVDLWVRAINQGLIGKNIDIPLVNFRFDFATYRRRKEWNNIKLMIKVWKSFLSRGYCSRKDYIYVATIQYLIFIMPNSLLRWSYDHLR